MKIKQKIAIGYTRLKLKLLTVLSKRMAAKEAFKLFCTPYLPKLKKAPHIFDKAEQLNFLFNGLNVRGYRWNYSRPNKILIIHGFDSQAYKFSRYVEKLLQKDYEVLAFDAPAHGNSEGKIINVQQYASMIEEAIKCYGPFTGYMAHSFGGLALSLALEHTTHDSTTKVVFIAPATETVTTLAIVMQFLRINNKEVIAEIHRIIFKLSGKTVEWFSMKRAMHNINASVLWFHDTDDDATPLVDALKVRDEQLPNIEFVITSGLGHRRIYHEPSVRDRIIDFL